MCKNMPEISKVKFGLYGTAFLTVVHVTLFEYY